MKVFLLRLPLLSSYLVLKDLFSMDLSEHIRRAKARYLYLRFFFALYLVIGIRSTFFLDFLEKIKEFKMDDLV